MSPLKSRAAVQHGAPAFSPVRRILHILRPYRRGFFVLLIPFCCLLTWIAQKNPETVERVYSRGIYPALSVCTGWFFGLLPFSLAGLLIPALAVWAVIWLIFGIFRIICNEGKRRLPGMLATAGAWLGVGYFLFTVFCGLNYYRITFADQSGLQIRPSSAAELALLYAELVEQINEIRPLVAQNESGVMVFAPYSAYDMAKSAPDGIARLSASYPVLGGFTPRPKPVLGSRVMSAMDITGIYIPFTFEANINVDVPDYNIPFSMMHELAHFKGFMREDEANFIAFLACREMDDAAWRYSGLAIALVNCGNALYSANPDLYWHHSSKLLYDVQRDFDDNRDYWKQFEGPISDFSVKANDVYLKTNRQLDGVKSYGRMVDLLLADYRMRHGLGS